MVFSIGVNQMKNGIKFKAGQFYLTRGVNDRIAHDEEFAKFVLHSLRRHLHGDWGDLCPEDKRQNLFSLDKYLRLFSAYINPKNDEKIWIITEADRTATTVLFPEEY